MLHFTKIQHKVNDVINSFISHKKHENNTRRAWKAQNNTRLPITLIHTHHQHKSTAILNEITSRLNSLQRNRRHRSQVFRRKKKLTDTIRIHIPYTYKYTCRYIQKDVRIYTWEQGRESELDRERYRLGSGWRIAYRCRRVPCTANWRPYNTDSI